MHLLLASSTTYSKQGNSRHFNTAGFSPKTKGKHCLPFSVYSRRWFLRISPNGHTSWNEPIIQGLDVLSIYCNLIEQGLLDTPILYLSGYIIQHKTQCYEPLNASFRCVDK